mmetsp:Transcript_25023/g.75427  ORF Transcript_25023/g.75427 Transcript_25023/m.75427 type:complete len:92 (+) Transcript_25023:492-767(+)
MIQFWAAALRADDSPASGPARAAVFATTAVGTFAEFIHVKKVSWNGDANDGEHTYKPDVGLIIASINLVVAYLMVVTSCCVSRRSEYESIA